jgi:hypothetical protein
MSLSIPIESKFEWDRTDSEVSTPSPLPRSQNRGVSSLRLRLPFRVSPVHHHKTGRDPFQNRAVSSLPRFFPLQRLSITKSHIHPAVPNSPVMLRPQGFAPSRRLAPLVTSQAYSIPVPLMGFNPSRPQSSPGAVRPLERRAPKSFSSTKRRGLPSRDSHTKQSPSPGLGISQAPFAGCLLGLSRSEVSCSQQ